VGETRSYDADYRLTGLIGAGSSAVQGLAYTYDAASNVTSIMDAVNAGANQNFSYDSLDRLTGAAGSYGNLSYTYDSVGNRLSQAGDAAVSYAYAAQSNQLAAVSSGDAQQAVGHTKTGHLNRFSAAADRTFDLFYNQAGRLATVMNGDLTVAQYSYDAFGRRLIRAGSVFGMTLYQYDRAGHLLEEAGGDGKPLADYIYLGDTPVAVISPAAGQMYWLHTGMLGAPQVATDSGQNVVWGASYGPFGGLDSTPVSIVQNLRLPGQEFDIETGLYHNGFRNYVPALGRYLETDPLGIAAGMNTYVYAGANPVNSIDPLGLREDLIFAAPGSDQWNSFYTAPSVPNVFTVGGHGNPYALFDVNLRPMTAQQVADIIRSNPNYHEGETVRLDACNTGVNPGTIEGSFAQQLANALHAPVQGPDNFVFSGAGQTPIVTGRMPNPDTTPGAPKWVPDYSHPGLYNVFLPKTLGDFNAPGSPVI
jgi:RHS repeat-associated protein